MFNCSGRKIVLFLVLILSLAGAAVAQRVPPPQCSSDADCTPPKTCQYYEGYGNICGNGFGVCPNPAHTCFEQDGAGCSDETCCNNICGIDPFCCNVDWDGICVSEANSLCGPPPEEPDPEELFDLEQKIVDMQTMLNKLNIEFSLMKNLLQQAVDEANAGNIPASLAHLQNALDFIELIKLQKFDLENLVDEFDRELESLDSETRSQFQAITSEIRRELELINAILHNNGEEPPIQGCGNALDDVADYISCTLNPGEDFFIRLQDLIQNGAIPALDDVIAEKENIENVKVEALSDLLDSLIDEFGPAVPPPFNPNSPALDELKKELFDLKEKGLELQSILAEADEELVDINKILEEARGLLEGACASCDSGGTEEDCDVCTNDDRRNRAARLIERAIVIKHIIAGPFECELASECGVCEGEGACQDGVKIQDFEELKGEAEEELVELRNKIQDLCNAEFIDDRRCDKFLRASHSIFNNEDSFNLLNLINEEIDGEGVSFQSILGEVDGELNQAIADVQTDADNAVDEIGNAIALVNQAIILKEFIEDIKIGQKYFFFLNFIINDIGTMPREPLDQIWLGEVKEEWFNIQVKLLWLNDMLKDLNGEIDILEKDILDIQSAFECEGEECSELEAIQVLLKKLVNAIVKDIITLVEINELTDLIDDIRTEKRLVEGKINLLCGEEFDDLSVTVNGPILDDDRLCDKLERKLAGMNKLLDFIDEELEEITGKLGDLLGGLFEFLFAILGQIFTVSDEPITSENYLTVIEQLYQQLGQAVQQGTVVQSIQPAQFEEFFEFALDKIRDARAEKETIELHKFPLLFERFRTIEDLIGGSVKPVNELDAAEEAEEVRDIQTKLIEMNNLLELLNKQSDILIDFLIAVLNGENPDVPDFAGIFSSMEQELDGLVNIKADFESEINALEGSISGLSDDQINPAIKEHILRNINKIKSLAELTNIEFFIMNILLDEAISAAENENAEDAFIFLVLFKAEKEAVEQKKLVAIEAGLLEIENALFGCDDDDHDKLFENPFCFGGCGLDDHCGDGKVQFALFEQCDDGNNVDNDGCTNACQLPRCGDGILQNGEKCDDGNNVDNDACSSECLIPDPDGDTICDNTKGILPCQYNQGCETNLDCGMGGACMYGTCKCPGVKCEGDVDCVGHIDCTGIGQSCAVPGACEFCDDGECKCSD